MAIDALLEPETDDELYLMVNVLPEDTGLPFVVWISPKGRARHDARVKVGARAGDFTASASVRPKVEVVAGELDSASLRLLARWIDLNRDTILAHWDGTIFSSKQVLSELKHLREAED